MDSAMVLDENVFAIEGGELYGGNQYWFERDGGAECGATTAANIFAYFLKTRSGPGAEDVKGIELDTKAGYMNFMELVRKYIHWSRKEFGLQPPSFIKGSNELAGYLGLPVRSDAKADRFRIAEAPMGRQAAESMIADARGFIKSSIGMNAPLAFLNLSPLGFLSNRKIDSQIELWHWVTVIGLDDRSDLKVKILDNNRIYEADLTDWMRDGWNSGSFVRLRYGADAAVEILR
ncbi:MAG: hypothetical protein LBK04_07810 [Clostridiales Family XIII bacterium]|jgi:hypothetical protein|nr:hypothetical protein [Clostridiales Family XIII bacterium]